MNENGRKEKLPLRTSFRVRLQSFLPARGLAMGAKDCVFFFSFTADLSASLSLPISLSQSFSALSIGK